MPGAVMCKIEKSRLGQIKVNVYVSFRQLYSDKRYTEKKG